MWYYNHKKEKPQKKIKRRPGNKYTSLKEHEKIVAAKNEDEFLNEQFKLKDLEVF